MTSKKMQISLSETELTILKKLIGRTFEFIGGESLPDFLISDVIVLATDELAIKVSGDIFESEIEGYPENYSKVDITELTDSQVRTLRASGETYLEGAGLVVQDVSLVTRTTSEFKNGLQTWSIESLRAIVLNLGSTNLIVCRLGDHDEVLAASFVKNFSFSSLPAVSNYLEEDLETKYEFIETSISLLENNG
jgi:hypothetical protein